MPRSTPTSAASPTRGPWICGGSRAKSSRCCPLPRRRAAQRSRDRDGIVGCSDSPTCCFASPSTSLAPPRSHGGLPDVPAGHHRRGRPAGDRSAWSVRLDQASEHRDQPLVLQPELGVSKAWGPAILELIPAITFFTRNDDFLRWKDPRERSHLLRAGTPHLR